MSASRALSSGGIKVELNDLLNVFMKKKKMWWGRDIIQGIISLSS